MRQCGKGLIESKGDCCKVLTFLLHLASFTPNDQSSVPLIRTLTGEAEDRFRPSRH
jgi:hypothetical protein